MTTNRDPATGACAIAAARTEEGYCLKLTGRCTMQQSPVLQEFAQETLGAPDRTPAGATHLLLNVADCEYMDSTFLGCILSLQRRYGQKGLLKIFAPDAARRRLFAPCRLDKVLSFTDALPPMLGEARPLDGQCLDAGDHAKHIMECHRLLAELGGPNAAAFKAIADTLEKELKIKESLETK